MSKPKNYRVDVLSDYVISGRLQSYGVQKIYVVNAGPVYFESKERAEDWRNLHRKTAKLSGVFSLRGKNWFGRNEKGHYVSIPVAA